MDILKHWELTSEQLSEIIEKNPSLRGYIFGHVAEYKLLEMWFSKRKLRHVIRYDSHDRGRKGDISFTYKSTEIRVEAKSLQTSSVKQVDDSLVGKAQVDASDRRAVTLPDGKEIQTTCLLVNQFDLLAVNIFEFEKKWQFAFALNRELPRSTYYKYAAKHRKYLLATNVKLTWPLEPPFSLNPYPLLDQIVREKRKRR
ncbi:MAG: restriction endonuclease [Planctomycetota bacterium]|jgi:hypothetical protein